MSASLDATLAQLRSLRADLLSQMSAGLRDHGRHDPTAHRLVHTLIEALEAAEAGDAPATRALARKWEALAALARARGAVHLVGHRAILRAATDGMDAEGA